VRRTTLLAAVLLALAGLAAGAWLGWRRGGPPDLSAHEPAIRSAATAHGLDPYLLMALVAAESGGRADARSAAGAVGLAQLMPATGEEEARRRGIPFQGEATLLDPATNVSLGASYLARLLDRFDGEVAFAVAAYNAGPERVVRWRNRAVDADPMTVIRREAFDETRRHVVKVMRWRDEYRDRRDR
jgi:soluble lytic murein transglycosylase